MQRSLDAARGARRAAGDGLSLPRPLLRLRSSSNGPTRPSAGACARSSSASEFGRNDVVKNSHYLLAETYSELGREHEADDHYDALANYYPNFPALKNYLHQISLMGMINLRA